MKNILLCNNAMGIGGVETVILNQITAFTRRGYNVYVVAGKGIYSDKIEELGGKYIEFDFPEENDIDEKKVNKLVKIIQEKEITEIHIHKYQCITSVLPAALITQIPYFAYEHSVWDTKKYYTWNYPLYKILFPIYFKNAYKVIAITPNTAKFTQNEYNVPIEKYIIVHNGIDLELYKNKNFRDSMNFEKILIISRFCEEKLPTIFSGIDIFKNLLEKNEKAKLSIIGDGDRRKSIEEYIEKNNLTIGGQVELLGVKNNIRDYLENTDLLLGVDRCVLEAIAMKVPAVITGYKGIKGLVCKNNIDMAIEENFSGDNMPTIDISECMEQIENLKFNKKTIVEENHAIAEEKLNCYKNYLNMPDDAKISFNWIDLFGILKQNIDLIEKQYVDIKKKYDWIQKIENENKGLLQEREKESQENARLQQENINLKRELENVYNSKRWRYAEKLSNIFHKKKINKN